MILLIVLYSNHHDDKDYDVSGSKMQPHDRVNFGGLCFACSLFLSRASRGFSLISAVPFIAYRSRCMLVYTHLLGSCSDSWFKERGI